MKKKESKKDRKKRIKKNNVINATCKGAVKKPERIPYSFEDAVKMGILR